MIIFALLARRVGAQIAAEGASRALPCVGGSLLLGSPLLLGEPFVVVAPSAPAACPVKRARPVAPRAVRHPLLHVSRSSTRLQTISS